MDSSSQTRLQKQAPAALRIQVTQFSPADASPAAIPLLSPVSVPPPPPPPPQFVQVPVSSGQVPEQAQLASMFRSQCSLGDQAQSAGFGAQARTFG